MRTLRCQSISEFRSKIVLHARLEQVLTETRNMLRHLKESGDNQKLILLCGPTGAGKTTVLKILTNEILQQEAEKMEKDPAYLPVAQLSVAKVPEARSAWKRFWMDFGEAIGDVFVDQKSLPDKGSRLRQVSTGESTEALHRSARNQIIHRRIQQIFIDEPQHLLQRGQGRTEKDNLDVLKSLCAAANTLCVLIGPYELRTLVARDGQLIRRSKFIHFRAYGSSKQDHADFEDTIYELEALLPLPFARDLDVELLFERSLGCVGLLKDWLASAAQHAADRSAKEVTQSDLLATAFSLAELETLALEIEMGETDFHEKRSTRAHLRRFMGLAEESESGEIKKPRKYCPGVRNPKRDTLG